MVMAGCPGQVQVALRENKDDPELLSYQGQCQLVMGHLKEARKSFERVIEKSPATIDAYPMLARVLRRLDQPKEADQCMQQMVKNNESSLPAQVLYGQYLLCVAPVRRGEPASPEGPSTGAERFPGPHAGGVVRPGAAALRRGDWICRAGIQISEHTPDGYLLLAQTKAGINQRDEAMAALKRGLETGGTPGYADLLWHVANLHLDSGRPLEAKKVLAQWKRLSQNPTAARCLEARIEMREGHWMAALNAFQAVRPELTPRTRKS